MKIRIWQKIAGLSYAVKAGLTVMITILLIAAMLTGGYFLVAHAQDSASAAQEIAAAVQRNQHDICIASNEDNIKQLLLWQYILKLSPPKTPQQQQLDRQFEMFLDQVFKSASCPP